jgi:hypothetical protein
MSLAQRFERRLEGMVGSAFARVFKGQVEPVEIGSALQREATDKKAVMGNGRVLCPNRYRVTLGPSDYERLVPWEVQLSNSLAELVQEHLDEHGLATIGDIEVYLARDDNLHTGVFGVASRMEAQAPPRRRPYDSMSMPVVPGHPEQYVSPYGASSPDFNQPPIQQPPPYQPAARSAAPAPPQPRYGEPPRQRTYSAQLIVDGTPRTLNLEQGSNIVGRGTESDLQLIDQGVSRRHLDVHIAEGRAVAYDLGSTNGTSVNGHPVQSQQLQHGDVIRVGHTRLVFQEDTA